MTPFLGLSDAVSISSIEVSLVVTTSNLLNKVASVSRHSVNANRIPIQFLGPAPNGKYTMGCLEATFSGRNLKTKQAIIGKTYNTATSQVILDSIMILPFFLAQECRKFQMFWL